MPPILPPGFDPATGRFTSLPNLSRPNPQVRPASTYTSGSRSTSSSSSYASSASYAPRSYTYTRNRSAWQKFNDFIATIGNYIHEYGSKIITWIVFVVGAAAVIGLICWVISMFCDGFWMGVLGVIVSYIIVCIGYYGLVILACILAIPVYTIRYIFYNGWSLLLTIALVIGVMAYSSSSPSSSVYESSEPEIEQVMDFDYTPYRVTAVELNIRRQPSKRSEIVGLLHKGDIVKVKNLVNGFARLVDDNGDFVGYASTKYLTEAE